MWKLCGACVEIMEIYSHISHIFPKTVKATFFTKEVTEELISRGEIFGEEEFRVFPQHFNVFWKFTFTHFW